MKKDNGVFRDLTEAEKAFATGARTITVIGRPPVAGNGPGALDGPGAIGNDGGGDETGHQPDGDNSFCDNLAAENLQDSQVDFQAQQIANAIKAMPDWNEREYAAVVYKINGIVKIGPLARGETVAEAQQRGAAVGESNSAPETRIILPNDLGDGQILAVVHNHPAEGYNDPEDLVNRYPSNNIGANGDYQTFNALVGIDSRFINSAGFAQYILGPDGALREFNASEGVVTPATDENPEARTDLSQDRQQSC